MFNSTPPTTRLRRGAAAAAAAGATGVTAVGTRRQTIIRESNELPYVSPVSNYSYGSKVANLPKPPRLSDTKVGLADALTEKTAAVEARLKEEEIVKEKERETAARRKGSREDDSARNSMPPPPSRGQSVVPEADDMSTISGMDMSRTFTSEFGMDPVLSNRIKETETGPEDKEKVAGSPKKTRRNRRTPARTTPARILRSTVLKPPENTDNSSGDESPGIFEAEDNVQKSTMKPLQPSNGLNGTNGGARSTPLGKPMSTSRQNQEQNTENPRRRIADGDKENYTVKDDGGFVGHTRHAAMAMGATPMRQGPLGTGRTRRINIDDGRKQSDFLEPSFRDQPLDWIFNFYHRLRPGFSLFGYCFVITVGLCFATAFLSGLFGVDILEDGFNPWPREFRPPSAPPKNIPEFASRLDKAERAVAKLNQKDVPGLTAEMKNLWDAIRDGTVAKESHFTNRLASLEMKSKDYLDRVMENERYIQELRQSVVTERNLRSKVQEILPGILPERLVVNLNDDGSIALTPEFEKAIKEIHNTREPTRENIKGAPSWESFFEKNRRNLQSEIQAIVGRENSEMKYKIAERDKKFQKNENKLSEQAKRLAQQEEELAQQSTKLSHQESRQGRVDQVVVGLEKTMELINMKFQEFERQDNRHKGDLGQRFDELEASLQRRQESMLSEVRQIASSFSGKQLSMSSALPDFASQMVGGRIWSRLTSPSHFYTNNRGAVTNFFAGLVGGSTGYAPPPAVAIMPTHDVGDCWPFSSLSPGILAIRLREEIVVTHVTIEHESRARLLDERTVPKIIEFWVNVENREQRTLIEEASLQIANGTGTEKPEDRIISPDPPKAFVKLYSFEYDINGGTSQTFALPRELVDLQIKSGLVAFRVMSNHGHNEYTCLYRVKVHAAGNDARRRNTEKDNDKSKEAKRSFW